MSARFEIRLFGEPSFALDGRAWRFTPPRALPVLTYLLVHAGGTISRARLAALLWPDDTDEAARANLRRYLHGVIRGLPAIDGVEWIISTPGTVAWNTDAPAWIDIVDFKRFAADAQLLPRAVELYRGELLSTLFDEWILAERGHLHAIAMTAMYEMAVAARTRRDYATAIAHAERMLAFDEWREDALREVIAARYESGDRSAALAAYERFALRLHTEMAVEPMPETLALRDAIVAGSSLASAAETLEPDTALEASSRAMPLPFVGRDETLERLRAAWTRAAHRSGTLVFVAGEPGIGKSRLAAELAAIVALQGGRTLVGLTSSPQRAPYQALVDAVRRGLSYLVNAAVDPIWLSVIASVVPEVHGVRANLQPVEPIEPRAARGRLHEAFARVFEAIAQTRPLLLVMEDLHWADSDTIEALAFLARRVGGMPILILALYRDDIESTHPLREARRELLGEGRATGVALARLNANDIARLIEGTPGDMAAPGRLAQTIHAISEGNPLFASQLLEDYIETGAEPSQDGLADFAQTIRTRIDRLDDDVAAVADVAATIGREFSVELVCAAGGWSEDAVLDALGSLLDRRLVRETTAPGFEYCFTHVLIANAVYERGDATARAKRHRRLAHVLEASGRGASARAAIAYHYDRAGDDQSAGRAYVAAAASAMAVFARADAIALARRGLALLEDDRKRFEALSILLQVQISFGDTKQMGDEVDQINEIAQRLGLDEQFAAREFAHEYFMMIGDFASHRDAVAAMVALAERTGRTNWRARALDARGEALLIAAELREGEACLREAIALARADGDRALEVRARGRIIQILSRSGDMPGAERELQAQREALKDTSADNQERLHLLVAEASCAEFIEDAHRTQRASSEMLAFAERIGDVHTAAKAHGIFAYASHQLFDYAGMRRHYALAEATFEARGQLRSLAVSLGNHGALELQIGNIDESIRLTKRSHAIINALGMKHDSASAVINLAEASLLAGDLREARAQARQGLVLAQRSKEPRLVAEAKGLLGSILCDTGDPREGLALLREGIAEMRELPMPGTLGNQLCMIVEALLNAGETEEASRYAAELERLFEEIPEQARYPTRICFALGRNAEVHGESAAETWLARGKALLDEQLARFADPADAKRYAALPFNRATRANHPSGARVSSGQETRTSLHSS